MNLFIVFNILIGLLAVTAINGQPSDRRTDEWYKEEWPAQPYAFGYEIRDISGNEQYRKEMSDGDRVTGSYGYLGPDGLYRHVEYIADVNGFRAKIRTSEPGTANDNPSNVQIESNPILVVSPPASVVSPITPSYGDISTNSNPGLGYRRDGLRPPNRPPPNPNPNRSTLPNPVQPSPRQPDESRNPNPSPPISGDRYNPNRGPEGPQLQPQPQPIKPNFEDPSLRPQPNDGTRGGPPVADPNRVTFGDLPDNVIPYRGGSPKKPIDNPPRDVPQFNKPSDIPNTRNDEPIRPPYVRPPYRVRDPSSPHSSRSPPSPYDQPRQPIPPPDASRRPRPDDRRYEVSTKGGPTKMTHDMGFIEATKGPGSPYRPADQFYNQRPSFDDESDDQFRRRQDNKSSGPVNKPVFEEGGPPRKVGGFVRSRFNASRPDVRGDGQWTGQAPNPVLRTSYNSSLNESSFDANQDRRDGYDKRVRRPTKVFVTNGPISGIHGMKGDDRPFAAIDAQQRQPIDSDFDNRGIRDGQIGFGGVKGRPDRDRPPPPTQADKTAQDIMPYYGARRDRDREPVPNRPQNLAPIPRLPSPSYDPRMEQNLQDIDEDIPVQRDDEYPREQPPDRQPSPHEYQPLMPNHRPDRQPLPRRPDRPYKPRVQSHDRPYIEQQFEVQPYQTQNSASITSPVNTIASVYKPVDNLEDNDEKPKEKNEEKLSLNTPLSPSSYKVTPFPVNETNIEIKPIIVTNPKVHTVPPELTQMEIPKFGTRLRTPEPVTQGVYKAIDQSFDYDKQVDQQSDYNNQNDENLDHNDYQYSDPTDDQNQNQSPIHNPNDNPSINLNDNPNDNPNPNSQPIDSVDNDQYYAYYDESENIESKENPDNSTLGLV